MAATPVVGYRLGINAKGDRARIVLRLQDGKQEIIEAKSAAEFTALALVLQESPVTYDPEGGSLLTGWEQGG